MVWYMLYWIIYKLCFILGADIVRSSRVVESQLSDFLVFLRRILSLRVAKRVSAFVKWIDPLMTIISYKCNSGNPHLHNLRTKLLAFHILEALLPACSDPVVMKQVRKEVLFLYYSFTSLFTWHCMIGSWLIPTNKHSPCNFCFVSDCGSVI